LAISRALENMVLTCSEFGTRAGNASKLFTVRIKPAVAASRLLAFWEGNVPVSTVPGFVSRYFAENIITPLSIFRNAWTDAEMKELDTYDASDLSRFLSTEGTPASPSPTTCKRHLCSLLMNAPIPTNQNRRSVSILSQPKDVDVAPERTRPAPLRLAEVPEDGAEILGESFSEPRIVSGRKPGPSTPLPQPAVLASVGGGLSSSESSSTSGSSSTVDLRRRRRRRHGKGKYQKPGRDDAEHTPHFCQLDAFKTLPKGMRNFLLQGGVSLWVLFDQIRLEVTTVGDLSKLQRQHN